VPKLSSTQGRIQRSSLNLPRETKTNTASPIPAILAWFFGSFPCLKQSDSDIMNLLLSVAWAFPSFDPKLTSLLFPSPFRNGLKIPYSQSQEHRTNSICSRTSCYGKFQNTSVEISKDNYLSPSAIFSHVFVFRFAEKVTIDLNFITGYTKFEARAMVRPFRAHYLSGSTRDIREKITKESKKEKKAFPSPRPLPRLGVST